MRGRLLAARRPVAFHLRVRLRVPVRPLDCESAPERWPTPATQRDFAQPYVWVFLWAARAIAATTLRRAQQQRFRRLSPPTRPQQPLVHYLFCHSPTARSVPPRHFYCATGRGRRLLHDAQTRPCHSTKGSARVNSPQARERESRARQPL